MSCSAQCSDCQRTQRWRFPCQNASGNWRWACRACCSGSLSKVAIICAVASRMDADQGSLTIVLLRMTAAGPEPNCGHSGEHHAGENPRGSDLRFWREADAPRWSAHCPQSPPRLAGCDAFPDQTCPRRTACSIVDCAFGLTSSYLRTLASVPPAATPLTSRLAPAVVLVVATRVPADTLNGSKAAISRKEAPCSWCSGLCRYSDGPPSSAEPLEKTFTEPLSAS